MAVLLQKYTYCQKFIFEEKGEILIEKTVGEMIKGTVALQAFPHRDYLRITLIDVLNATKALAKDIKATLHFNTIIDKTNILDRILSDDLCHFDFSKNELKNGSKMIKVQGRFVNNNLVYLLLCYDFKTYSGRSYFFSDFSDIEQWAKQLGITEYEIADLSTGDIIDIESF